MYSQRKPNKQDEPLAENPRPTSLEYAPVAASPTVLPLVPPLLRGVWDKVPGAPSQGQTLGMLRLAFLTMAHPGVSRADAPAECDERGAKHDKPDNTRNHIPPVKTPIWHCASCPFRLVVGHCPAAILTLSSCYPSVARRAVPTAAGRARSPFRCSIR